MSNVKLTPGAGIVTQPCELLCGASFPPGSSFNSLSGGMANGNDVDLAQLAPARSRSGIEELPFSNYDPIASTNVPPPTGGWGEQVAREDDLMRFTNRNTRGLDGGGRSTDITRFQVQLEQWQQADDASRWTSFERMMPAQTKGNQTAYP